MISRLERHRHEIHSLVSRHHASNPRLFGSMARGDDGPASDLDLLVDFEAEASILDEVALRLALVDLLQIDVDVVGANTLRGAARTRILREAVAI